MHENRNEQNTGTKTIKKIGRATYEVVVHFNENATETMQDKLKRIMLREMININANLVKEAEFSEFVKDISISLLWCYFFKGNTILSCCDKIGI